MLLGGRYGHARNLTVSWYGNACACRSENSYTNATSPTIDMAIKGTVAATVEYGLACVPHALKHLP